MRGIVNKLKLLSTKVWLNPSYYKQEAKNVLKQYNKSDPNFKYFFTEVILNSKDFVETETLREIVSELQKTVAFKISQEGNSEEFVFVKNKVKKM